MIYEPATPENIHARCRPYVAINRIPNAASRDALCGLMVLNWVKKLLRAGSPVPWNVRFAYLAAVRSLYGYTGSKTPIRHALTGYEATLEQIPDPHPDAASEAEGDDLAQAFSRTLFHSHERAILRMRLRHYETCHIAASLELSEARVNEIMRAVRRRFQAWAAEHSIDIHSRPPGGLEVPGTPAATRSYCCTEKVQPRRSGLDHPRTNGLKGDPDARA